jgi:hypothetical protein
MTRHGYFLFSCMLFFHGMAKGQHISQAMQFVSPVEAKDSNTLFFTYINLCYLKNYEYFSNIQTGYTLFGVWQRPGLSYMPNKWLKLEAGLLVQKDFGDKDFDHVSPTFSLQLQSKYVRFLFGALEGAQSHQLIEPLMQYDQVIERPIEEGVQFKIATKKLKADAWLDWQKRQKVNADNPEQLAPGVSLAYTLSDPSKPLLVKIPLQATFFHQGGQLDTSNVPTSTIFNHAEGLWIEWNNPQPKNWLRQVRADLYYTGYKHSESDVMVPFNKGSGFLANVFLASKWNVSFLASYWNGNKYISPQGGKLYQSITSRTDRPGYTEAKRSLLFLNFLYEKELLPGLFADCRITPYFDFNNQLFEYSYQVVVSYRHSFRLANFNKKAQH